MIKKTWLSFGGGWPVYNRRVCNSRVDYDWNMGAVMVDRDYFPDPGCFGIVALCVLFIMVGQ